MPKSLVAAETQALLTEYRRLADEHGARAPETIAVRNRIVEGNLGLAFDVWRKGFSRRVPHEDVLGIGAQGLMKAIERFDCTRGLRFSTYATHWIRHALGRTYQNEATIVRIPVHAQDRKKAGQCRTAADAARRMCSLDATLDPDTRETFAGMTEDPGALAAFDELEQEQAGGEVAAAVGALPEPHRTALQLHAEGATLREVAQQLGVSRERARQLHAQAVGRVRRALAA